MKKIYLLVVSLFAVASVHASLMQMSATFSGLPVDVNGSGQSFPFGGAFTYLYDGSLIPSSGTYEITDVAPTSLFLDHPTIGATTFDLSNTFVRLNFTDGLLFGVTLGDRGDVAGVGVGRDDFTVLMFDDDAGPSFRGIFYTLSDTSNVFGMDLDFPGSFSTAAVPETSSTVVMLGIGLVGLALVRYRRPMQLA